MLHVACCMLHVACCMSHVACRMLHVVRDGRGRGQVDAASAVCCKMHDAACSMQRATCSMQHAACSMEHETCNLKHASCPVHHALTCTCSEGPEDGLRIRTDSGNGPRWPFVDEFSLKQSAWWHAAESRIAVLKFAKRLRL